MKRYISIAVITLFFLTLISCATNRTAYINNHFTEETWMSGVEKDPSKWLQGSDAWFMNGNPYVQVKYLAPYSVAMSNMSVNVSDFTNIKTNGNFQVQIYGTQGNNCVTVDGPNSAVRAVKVEVIGNMLCITQAEKAPSNMRQVIVRIGVRQLNNLVQMGGGPVEGLRLFSNGLNVTSSGCGNVYLSGNLNVHRITSTNKGSVIVFGANTSMLDIKTTGAGCVKVSGNIALRTITHGNKASGDISIIGANGNCETRIYAQGRGKISINGRVNIREVRASGHTCVYAYPVNSGGLYVYTYDSAKVGLAGSSINLFVDTSGSSIFYGRYLCVRDAYVRAHDWSHVNVTASNKVFAAATQNSSVYFFGSPSIMSQFVSANGVVIPVWIAGMPSCAITGYRATVYKGAPQNNSGYMRRSYKR